MLNTGLIGGLSAGCVVRQLPSTAAACRLTPYPRRHRLTTCCSRGSPRGLISAHSALASIPSAGLPAAKQQSDCLLSSSSSSGGGGGGPPPVRRSYGPGNGDGDGGREGFPGRQLQQLLQSLPPKLLLAVLVAVFGVAELAAPATATAAAAPANSAGLPGSNEAVDATPLTPLSAGGGGSSSTNAAPGTAGGSGSSADASSAPQQQQRLKRLLREAFSELTDLRSRLEALEAAAAEAEDAAASGEAVVVPMEGFAVRPYSRSLAAGLRLRCRAQVSGHVEAPAVLPFASLEEQIPWEGDNVAPTGLSIPTPPPPLLQQKPRLQLRIQSVWGASEDGEDGVAAAVATAVAVQPPPPSPAAVPRAAGSRSEPGGQGEQGAAATAGGGRRVAAHLQLGSEEGGGGVVVDKLLLKAEAHPRLRVLLATHGSLENIAKNVNPFAAGGGLPRGLTASMRRGHDLSLLSDSGGAGAAVAATAGELSLAVGAFNSASVHAAASPLEAASGAARTSTCSSSSRSSTCAQLSLHRSRRIALSAIWAQTTSCSPSPVSCSSSSPPPPSCLDADGGGAGRCLQRGLVAAVQLNDRLTASAWLGTADSSAPSSSGASPAFMGRSSGAGAGSTSGLLTDPWAGEAPSPSGEGLAVQGQQQWRQRRMGVRLATLPDEDTGRSYGLCVSHRRNVVADVGNGTGSSGMLVVEASASLPVAHGVLVTPGVVLSRRCGATGGSGAAQTVLLAGAQTTWSF